MIYADILDNTKRLSNCSFKYMSYKKVVGKLGFCYCVFFELLSSV